MNLVRIIESLEERVADEEVAERLLRKVVEVRVGGREVALFLDTDPVLRPPRPRSRAAAIGSKLAVVAGAVAG